jgi:hypothetical protein
VTAIYELGSLVGRVLPNAAFGAAPQMHEEVHSTTLMGARTMISKSRFKNSISLGLAILGLAAVPGTARADFLDFTVVESAVPGSPLGPTFIADDINGKYQETLSLTVSGGPCPPGALACGSFYCHGNRDVWSVLL